MNTSLLFHAFGAQGLVVTKTEYKNSKVYVFAYTNSDKLRCPCCHSKDIIRRGTVQRELRGVPIGLDNSEHTHPLISLKYPAKGIHFFV